MNIIKELVYRLRGECTTEKLKRMGMKVGRNFSRLNGVILDPSHCWLIEIGDDVIIGANSTVTKDIPDNSVAVGCPARVICKTDDYIAKERAQLSSSPIYGEEYTLRGNVSMEMRLKQKKELDKAIGYID